MSMPMPSTLPDPHYEPLFYDGVAPKRFFAWLIDVVLITLTTLIIGLLTFGIGWIFWPVFYLTIAFLYRWFTISSASATLGMRVMNIELRGPTGARFNTGEAAIHTATYMACSAFAVPQIISIILMVVGDRHQGLHDLVIGSAAINRPR